MRIVLLLLALGACAGRGPKTATPTPPTPTEPPNVLLYRPCVEAALAGIGIPTECHELSGCNRTPVTTAECHHITAVLVSDVQWAFEQALPDDVSSTNGAGFGVYTNDGYSVASDLVRGSQNEWCLMFHVGENYKLKPGELALNQMNWSLQRTESGKIQAQLGCGPEYERPR